MPSVLTENMFPQTATLWTASGTNFYNEPSYSTTLIPVRYQEKREVVKNKHGQEIVASSVIYCQAEIEEESYIALGDFSGTLDPAQVERSARVVSSGSSPSIDADEKLYKAWL